MLSRRRFIKLCASTAAVWSIGASVSRLIVESAAPAVPALLYHRVGYGRDHFTVSPERFAADLAFLVKRGYQAISLDAFQNFILDRDVKLPEKPVLITFDDGYLDNYQNAFPILKWYGMTASFFVITGMLWEQERLAPQHIVEMAEAGMSFGSHTVTHRSLSELAEEEALSELADSKVTLESILGTEITFVAYPKGSYNQRTIRLASQLGYVGGFSTINGRCYKDTPDFILRRIPIFGFDRDLARVMAERGRLQ
ncbi:MAG: polysaccharide deacetylase family protein [Negativicutes bacterium]|nr:polysaccharide deacetylase family protein [Negativicutes bacterium]